MRWELSWGPGCGWCTYVLDYRRFPCFYSNKWHSLYSCGQLDSLTVDRNKYCMWLTLSCQLRAEPETEKCTWRWEQLHFLGSCHNCHILMIRDPPSYPPISLSFFARCCDIMASLSTVFFLRCTCSWRVCLIFFYLQITFGTNCKWFALVWWWWWCIACFESRMLPGTFLCHWFRDHSSYVRCFLDAGSADRMFDYNGCNPVLSHHSACSRCIHRCTVRARDRERDFMTSYDFKIEKEFLSGR